MTKAEHLDPPDDDNILAWVSYVGGDVAKFGAEYAGHTLYIPANIRADHHLSVCLGFEVAAKLCGEVGSSSFYVPSSMRSNMASTRLLVLILSWAKIQINEIASAADMTARQIARYRRDLRADGLLPPAENAGSSRKNER